MYKLINILLTLILLTSIVGVSVSKHYCGGELQMVSVNTNTSACGDGMPMDMECCDDEVQFFSLDEELQLKQISVEIATPSFEYLFISFVIVPEVLEKEHTNKSYSVSHSPPDLTDIYVQVQSFLL